MRKIKNTVIGLTITSIVSFILLFLASFNSYSQDYDPGTTDQKLISALMIIRKGYVDTINEPFIVEKAIEEMLERLDPHSYYISKKDLDKVNEPLVGSFEGIGIQFQIFKDTILVVNPIAGGPSEKLGIQSGDKIVEIEGENATGEKLTNSYVSKRLRGEKGSKVMIGIYRKKHKELIEFIITRDKIPVNSIDAAFMVTPEIGYIKLIRFSRNSIREFRKSIKMFKNNGLQSLILDLRRNSGGYLKTAIDLSDEFLGKDKLVVYTEGLSSPKRPFEASSKGNFEEGKLVILIDEGSASASEIVSGAVQDWDRGIVIGRRSFGKGLVQRPYPLPDGSVIRLTTARYYTPTGRSIQRPYSEGTDKYYNELIDRYKNGELINPDSIQFPDSLKYYTPKNRVVYGGGGIMPDIFVPLDTTHLSSYFSRLRRKGILNSFALDYVDINRVDLLNNYKSLQDYINKFKTDNDFFTIFTEYAKNEGVEKKVKQKGDFIENYITYLNINRDSINSKYSTMEDFAKNFNSDEVSMKDFLQYLSKTDRKTRNDSITDVYTKYRLKALIARNLWGVGAYYEVIADIDEGLNKAIEVIQNDTYFSELNRKRKR